MIFNLVRSFALLLFAAMCMFAQNQDSGTPPAEPPPKPQFFAGTVTQLNEQQITVSRTTVGRAPETRVFIINSKTKIGTKATVKTRVTVRYQQMPEGDVALEIIEEPASRSSKPS